MATEIGFEFIVDRVRLLHVGTELLMLTDTHAAVL
jgi:hypothetical protein